MSTDADQPGAAAPEADPEPLDAFVSRAQQAFERGDFSLTRSILSQLDESGSQGSFTERDQAVIRTLTQNVAGDRFTMTLGFVAAGLIAAIFAYYVLM